MQALSGGNQQKVALAKWMPHDPLVLLLNDPTRGVDVETKREIYIMLRQFAAAGKAVVLLSSDTPELVHLCDRVAVMREGRMVAMLDRTELSEEAIVAAAVGADTAKAGRMSATVDTAPKRVIPLYWPVQANRNAGLVGLFVVVLLFIVVYGVLFPGLFTLSGFAKFTQSWFPLALVAMAQAIADADRGHQPGDRRDRQPWRGDRRDDDDGTARRRRRQRGGRARRPGNRGCDWADRRPAQAAGDRRDAGRLLHHRRRGAAYPAATGRRRPRLAVRPARRQHADGLRYCSCSSLCSGSSIWRRRSASASTPPARIRSAPIAPAFRSMLRASPPMRSAVCSRTGAGLFVAAQTGSGDPVIGTAFTLNSIAAAVLGGIGFLGGQGTMRGALAGSLLLSLMISVMFFLGFTPVAQYVAQGLIIIGAVALPQLRRRRR